MINADLLMTFRIDTRPIISIPRHPLNTLFIFSIHIKYIHISLLFFLETIGFEPITPWVQFTYSTNWTTSPDDPYGIWTRVTAVKEQCPRPLDERDIQIPTIGLEPILQNMKTNFKSVVSTIPPSGLVGTPLLFLNHSL